MGMMGGGMMTPLGGANDINLVGTDGTSEFIIRDGDGFPIFSVDSQGNVKRKGVIDKI